MVFLDKFLSFYREHFGEFIGIYFHTSIVQESQENIKKLIDLNLSNVNYYIPKDCMQEIRILKDYSNYASYRSKSKYICDSKEIKKIGLTFNDILDVKKEILYVLNCDVALFVFCEPAAAEEFSSKMGIQKNVFVYNVDLYSLNNSVILPSGIIHSVRKCKPLNISFQEYDINSDDTLVLKDAYNNLQTTLKYSELYQFGMGGESFVCTHEKFPGDIFKIYWFELSVNMIKKLKLLMEFRSLFGSCTLPVALIYLRERCIGYLMKKQDGIELSEYLYKVNYTFEERKNLIKKISVVLLELKMAQYIITDLSVRNLYVDIGKEREIKVIDCDSAEFYCYPGGGVTGLYGHPDFKPDDYYQKLRKQEHFYFSYAVLIFEILMGWNEPLRQRELGDVELQWRKHAFPYANSLIGHGIEAKGVKTNPELLKVWKSQPLKVRKLFVDVFNFKKIYSFGDWFLALKIL